MDKFLDVNQLADFLNVKVNTIYGWVHEGYIPYYKIGRLVRFKEKDILEWINKKKCSGRVKRVPEINL